MGCASRTQGEKLTRGCRSALGLATLGMPTVPAACIPCTQALIVEAPPQKSRAGGFPPPLLVNLSQTETSRPGGSALPHNLVATPWPARAASELRRDSLTIIET